MRVSILTEGALRFAQLTSPATAKGVEDTAFYRYFPLAALCEVGGDLAFVPGDQDRLDVWEVLVQRRPADAGGLGDLRHRHRQQPVLADQRRGGVQDRLAHLVAVRLDGVVPQPRHPSSIRYDDIETSCLEIAILSR
jgi:hypothetical protein